MTSPATGFQNGYVSALNANFTTEGNASASTGLITDNQIWIGTTALNAGGTHINVNTLTAGTGITFDKSNPGVFKINSTAASTDLHTARYIVSPGGAADGANYTTIEAAYAAAVGATGVQTVFVQPGTYTENLTLVAGVNITATGSDGLTGAYSNFVSPSVIIKGTLTASYSGSVTLSGIQLQTNGAAALATSGATTGNLILNGCSVYANNATGMTFNSTSLGVTFYNCGFNSTSTNLLFAVTSGSVNFQSCIFELSATASTSTIAASNVAFNACNMSGVSLSTTTTGSVTATNCTWIYNNTTLLTTVGTGTSTISNCMMQSGSSSTISIGAGTTVLLVNSEINSSNTNAITGAGTLQIGGTVFTGSSSTINTTTVTGLPLSLVQGGTNAALTASNGGIFYSTATAGSILAGTTTAGQILRSGSSTTPAWSTATYPATAGNSNNLLQSNGTNWVSVTPAGAGSSLVLISSQNASGVGTLGPFLLNSTYKTYKLIGRDVTLSVGGATLSIQMSSNGGSSYITTNYQSNLFRISNGATTFSNTGSATGLLIAFQTTSTPMIIDVIISQVEESSTPATSGQASTVNQLQLIQGGYTSTAFTANSFQLITSSGNVSGQFSLYGIPEA